MKLEKECTELSTELDSTEYVLNCFLANKKLEGCAKDTLDQYRWTANKLFAMMGKGYQYITKDDVKYYLAVRSRHVGKNTLVNEKRNLSSFFTWLHDEGLIAQNPVKPIKGIRGEDVEFKVFSVEEEVAIRDVQASPRDKAIIAFLLSAGVRVGEIAKMERNNVNLTDGTVTFRGEKSRMGKYRTVFLDARAKKYLSEYLLTRDDNNPALFVTERKYNGQPKRMRNQAFEDVTRKICESAGIYGKGTVHTFRRTCATRLHESGCPDQVIQQLLGHADVSTTTKHYIAKNVKKARTLWEQYAMVA